MTAQSKYYVIKKTICPICEGTCGTKYGNGFFACVSCKGLGFFMEEVDLALALTEIAAEVEAALAKMAIIRGNKQHTHCD